MGGILNDYISLDQLAAECGVSIRTARRWVTETVPGLPITRIGRKPYVSRDDWYEWCRARRIAHNVRGR